MAGFVLPWGRTRRVATQEGALRQGAEDHVDSGNDEVVLDQMHPLLEIIDGVVRVDGDRLHCHHRAGVNLGDYVVNHHAGSLDLANR